MNDQALPVSNVAATLLRDIVSHDADVISQVVGYHVEDVILSELREHFDAEVVNTDPIVAITVTARYDEDYGAPINDYLMDRSGDVEALARDILFAAGDAYRDNVRGGPLYDVWVSGANVTEATE